MTAIEPSVKIPPIQQSRGGSGTVSGYVTSVVENLIELASFMPKEARNQLAVRVWETPQSSILVDLGATGVTVVDPRLLHHTTLYQPALRYLPADLESTFVDVDTLKSLESGWNGYDVAAPKIEAIHDAISWIEQMYEDVMRSGLEWRKPHVAADEHGDVTFEWWHGDKGLTIYVSAVGGVSYLKDWGPDMVEEMEVGAVTTSEERRELWAWFLRQ